ncbi:hypothetical protein CL617_01540 [archaeon]|nr:hypothetical protein [archaeon]|tara:strand:- start:5807 stop:7789 length:1983 start_codon:yes stop_codon:yes gene_type:complete
MEKINKTLMGMLGIVLLIAFLVSIIPGNDFSNFDGVKKFSSEEEIKNYIKSKQDQGKSGLEILESFDVFKSGGVQFQTLGAQATSDTSDYGSGGSPLDFSTTNIQVKGVDEADIVKNDGRYIYTAVNNKLNILDAYPAENLNIISSININGNVNEIFVNDDKLIVFGNEQYNYYGTTSSLPGRVVDQIVAPEYYESKSFVRVYDIEDRENPVLKKEINFEGQYYDSRMIDNYVYIILNDNIGIRNRDELKLPEINENGNTQKIDAEDVYYFDDIQDFSYRLTTIMAIDVDNLNKQSSKLNVLTGYTQNIFVSKDNIYLTSIKRVSNSVYGEVIDELSNKVVDSRERTLVHKISIDNGNILFAGNGEVPGKPLNQFSMDEYNGYFRIATTSGQFGSDSENNMYVLDDGMNVVGSIQGLARGEKIYSVRFMGERAYMVTFKKIDPLFVIDLSIPEQPKVLGELKIPGYSDYLHPYDENHVIGVGKDAVDAGNTGFGSRDFAWYQGLKMSLFDVTDPNNPKEVAKVNIGDRGTDSEALRDHKAFLFDREKELLVIPVSLHEINRNQNNNYEDVIVPNGIIAPNTYGQKTFEGAYVFNLNLNEGFKLRGRISHDNYVENGNYYGYQDSRIRRSLYIGDSLYTISNNLVKANDLFNLQEISNVKI